MKSLLKLADKLAITLLIYKGQGQLFRCLLWMPPAHSSSVCHHLAILFQPAQGKNRGPATWCHTHQPATCGSGQVSDNDPFSSHTYGLQSMCAQWGLVCTSLPLCSPFTDLENWGSEGQWLAPHQCARTGCRDQVFCRSFQPQAAFVSNRPILHIPLLTLLCRWEENPGR